MLVAAFILSLFGYTVFVANEATDSGAKPLDFAVVKELVKEDLKNAWENSSPVDYSKMND